METVSIARSASDKDKAKFIKENLNISQFTSLRALIDSGAIILDSLNTKGLDALLSSCKALSLDELSKDQAIMNAFSFDTQVVARVNANLADTLSDHGLQAKKGLARIHITSTFYVSMDCEIADFKQNIQEGLFDKVSHVSGGYGIAFREYNAAKANVK